MIQVTEPEFQESPKVPLAIKDYMEVERKSIDSLADNDESKEDDYRSKLPAITGHHSARSMDSDKALPEVFSGIRAGTRAGKRGLATLGVNEENTGKP